MSGMLQRVKKATRGVGLDLEVQLGMGFLRLFKRSCLVF